MAGKFLVLLIVCITCASCSNRFKTYRDFSFSQNDGVILDFSFLGEERTRETILHSDTTWTWTGILAPTFDLGYRLYCCSDQDSLFIFYGSDTLLLNDMLGPDSVWLEWFVMVDILHQLDVYQLINRRSGERHLYLSWGRDSFGNGPGRRINLVFPLSKDGRIEGGFAYVTLTSEPEHEPCLDCFTDFNRDGRTDFVQWDFGREFQIRYINFAKNGQQTYHHSGYRSVSMYQGMSWTITSCRSASRISRQEKRRGK